MSTPIPSIHGLTCLRAARTIYRQTPHAHNSHHFSTSAPRWPRGVKGTNKLRGLSIVRSSGPIRRRVQSIRPHELPVPVMDPAKRARVETSDNHGLWAFFNQDKAALTTPKELNEHGRAWTKKELRIKSLDDMHILWWKCHLELNRLATESQERKRLQPGYGKYELDLRRDSLKDTQKAIRETLQERYEAWQEARDILNKGKDPDLEISSDGRPVWRADANPYEVDELDGKMEPMTRPGQRGPPPAS